MALSFLLEEIKKPRNDIVKLFRDRTSNMTIPANYLANNVILIFFFYEQKRFFNLLHRNSHSTRLPIKKKFYKPINGKKIT